MQTDLRHTRPAIIFLFLFLGTVFTTTCWASDSARDRAWETVQTLLTGIHGISTVPPANLISSKYSSGALMGNGDIGVVAGDPSVSQQTFHFGKSDFWGARRPVRHNDPECNWGCQASILSLGALTIFSPGKSEGAGRVYRMDQDILHARVDTTLQLAGRTVHLRSWTADDTNIFVTELKADGDDPSALTVRVRLAMPARDLAAAIPFPAAAGNRNGMLWATRANNATAERDYNARAALAIHLLGAQFSNFVSTPTTVSGDFTLQGPAPVWIITAFVSDARIGLGGPTSEMLAQAALERAAQVQATQVTSLEGAHLDWWKKFWLRSFVQVHDKVLEEYYYGALYVLGCASRPGKLAPSLFGNFLTTDDVAWGAIYFMNYNEEAPYYGVFSSNHADLAEPYNRMVLAQLPWQRNRTARAGYAGVAYDRVFSLFTVFAKPPALLPVAGAKDYARLPSDQKSNATFSFLPLIQYYDYTQDRKFLQTELYPAMKQLDAFWRDFAVRDASGKRWIFEHSSAHEGGDDINPNLDIGFAARVERELLVASQVLGVDEKMRPVWQSFLDELSPYPSGQVSGKTVYYIAESVKNPTEYHGLFEPGDQPINLEGIVFPGENLAIGGDPAQLEIARNSMQEMNSWAVTKGGNSENGFCKIFPIAARIGWPADDLVVKFRAAILYQWRPSNLTVFQEGGGIETSGSIEGLDSMLLQHENGVLRVFPDWPASRDASFTWLRAKGAFLVSSEQRAGAVTSIEIIGERGGQLTILSPWGRRAIRVNGAAPAKNPDDHGRIVLLISA